MKITESFLAVL